MCCDSWGCKESDTTEQLHFHFHFHDSIATYFIVWVQVYTPDGHRSYFAFKVRRSDLVQGKEQWPCFAGAITVVCWSSNCALLEQL